MLGKLSTVNARNPDELHQQLSEIQKSVLISDIAQKCPKSEMSEN